MAVGYSDSRSSSPAPTGVDTSKPYWWKDKKGKWHYQKPQSEASTKTNPPRKIYAPVPQEAVSTSSTRPAKLATNDPRIASTSPKDTWKSGAREGKIGTKRSGSKVGSKGSSQSDSKTISKDQALKQMKPVGGELKAQAERLASQKLGPSRTRNQAASEASSTPLYTEAQNRVLRKRAKKR